MSTLSYKWTVNGEEHALELVRVGGTGGGTYLFGREPNRRPVEIHDFYLATTPVTQALWQHVMNSNESENPGKHHPVENVSWDCINERGGFLDRINAGEILTTVNNHGQYVSGSSGEYRRAAGITHSTMRFRLPSETEWEYAARGGPHWRNGFIYSGSNDPNEVAWYGPRWNRGHELMLRVFGRPRGWRMANRLSFHKPVTCTHEVASKAPNQLGIYDMSGNVWEWCQDVSTDDWNSVPADGSPFPGPGDERRLRGGCHHNWNLHCTVSWRYGIEPGAHDGCIGFRLALA